MSIQCAVCGHLLADADMACPTCLPNFYKPAERVWPTTSQSDKLLKGEGYPPAMDFTEPSDIVERLERDVAEYNGFSYPMDEHEIAFVKDDVRMLAAAEITRLRAALDEAFIQGLENAADIAKGERIEGILRSKVEHLRGRES